MNSFESTLSSPEIDKKETIKKISLEQQANFRGNYSELLFSRMSNPSIRGQLLDLMEANERWIASHPETVSEVRRDPITGDAILTDDDMIIFDQVPGTYIAKSRDELEADLNEGVAREKLLTKVDFNIPFDSSSAKKINPEGESDSTSNYQAVMGVMRDNSIPITETEVRDRSIVEAHEKGHVFRNFKPSQFLEDKFKVAFDVSRVTPEAYYGKEKRPDLMSDSDVNNSINGYLFDFKKPVEIMERMNQLKGYFGMKGDEKFTIQHLNYAREHYSKDVGLENHMQAFFDAITEETEFSFLKLINSVGV